MSARKNSCLPNGVVPFEDPILCLRRDLFGFAIPAEKRDEFVQVLPLQMQVKQLQA